MFVAIGGQSAALAVTMTPDPFDRKRDFSTGW
jgi:hypothetical protein